MANRPNESPPQRRRFQRTVEDFTCARCGTANIGDGYTNHCAVCLYSRHVDVSPGDRASPCGGLMRPVSVHRSKGRWKLTHECEQCGFTRANFARPGETDAVIRFMHDATASRSPREFAPRILQRTPEGGPGTRR